MLTILKPVASQGCAPDGHAFQIYQLSNNRGMSIQIMDWGASWISCRVPVGGELREVLLGCKPRDYLQQQAYMGASVGRYANRIAQSRFRLNAKTIQLLSNQGKHQLHGGPQGFDKKRWKLISYGDNFVCLSVFSADGDQGFRGNLEAFVRYQLNEQNEVRIEYSAVCDQDTPINLTNHAYFNLQDAIGGVDVRTHYLQLNADYFLPVDQQGIPNQALKSVQQTSFDFRQAKSIGQDFLQQEQLLTKGYDHSFLLDKRASISAVLTAPDKSLTMKLATSQPALQVYTGNFLAGNPNRLGEKYCDYAGVALESQMLPDSPNHPEWYQFGGITKAGKPYLHWTTFSFVSNKD